MVGPGALRGTTKMCQACHADVLRTEPLGRVQNRQAGGAPATRWTRLQYVLFGSCTYIFEDSLLRFPRAARFLYCFLRRRLSRRNCDHLLHRDLVICGLNNFAIGISWFSLPSSLEQWLLLEPWEWMRFSINNHLVKWQNILWSKEEVEVFQCLGLRCS